MIQKITIKNFRSIKEITISLQEYSLLVGSNNTGKSNVLKAIELFFDSKGKPKVEDFCNLSRDKTMYISVQINDDIITKEWKLKDDKVSLKVTPENKEILKRYIPIYIPTIEKIEDTTKTTGTNIFGQLLEKIAPFKDYDKYNKIKELVKEINEDKDNPIKELEQNLKNSLNTSFKSHLTPSINTNLQTQDLVKSMNILFKDNQGNNVSVNDLGSGMQRTVIYELIMLLNKIDKDNKYILLYDEPEICLHPSQQKLLAYHLKHELSKNMQIMVASHSPIFASSGISKLSSILKIEFTENTGSGVYQIVDPLNLLSNIENIYKSTWDDTTEYLDLYRYINWFNNERSQLFFAKSVLLVEGMTEKGVFEFLSENHKDWHFLQENHIYILDCLGKFDIIRWSEILKELNIPFGMIFDLDSDTLKNGVDHKKINDKIKELYSECIIDTFETNIEGYLNIEKLSKRKDNKEHNILLYIDKELDLDSIPKEIKDIIIDKRPYVEKQFDKLCEKIKEYFEKLI